MSVSSFFFSYCSVNGDAPFSVAGSLSFSVLDDGVTLLDEARRNGEDGRRVWRLSDAQTEEIRALAAEFRLRDSFFSIVDGARRSFFDPAVLGADTASLELTENGITMRTERLTAEMYAFIVRVRELLPELGEPIQRTGDLFL